MDFTTPTRSSRPSLGSAMPATPESQVLSSPIGANYSSPTPTYWGTPAGGIWPPSSNFASNENDSRARSSSQDSGKRGRPRADHISHLILEGTSSPSGIKCRVCNRVFPREKSLQAHLRTHTGERPYICDYPGCTRAFTQSGQLKTHQRLHAGEKPFVCSSPGCGNRYTHANRTCPVHPYHKPQRSTELVLQPNIGAGENTNDVQKWLENYRRERLDKTPAKSSSITDTPVSPATSPSALHTSSTNTNHGILDLGVRTSADILAHELVKRNRIKRGLVSELEQENISQIPHKIPAPESPIKQGLNLIQPRRTLGDITPKKDKNILPPEPIDNLSNIIPSSPVRSLKPKKRWIKTVVQEQKRQEIFSPVKNTSNQDEENLAMPIRWNENESTAMPLLPLIRRNNASPVNWSVVSALVDLGQTPQPLNLSTSGNRR